MAPGIVYSGLCVVWQIRMNYSLWKRVGTILALTWWVSQTSLIGQVKSPEPRPVQASDLKFSTSANLVLVPAVVVDKSGHHVPGLTVDDFALLEDGKAQKIAAFEQISAETSAVRRPAVAPNSFTNQLVALYPKRLEIILLDLLNTPLSGRVEAQRGLIQLLSKSADPDTLVALLVLRSGGVTLIHNFTTDPSVLLAALRQLQGPPASRDSPALNTNGGDVDAEARQLRAILGGQQAAANMGAHPTAGALIAMLRQDEALSDSSKQDEEALLTLESMREIGRYFAAVPGRKSLFWASTGFRFSIDSLAGEATRGTTPNDWQRAMQMLQEANIAVYPVDLGGVGLMGEGNASFHERMPANAGTGSLETARLADITMAKHLTMDTVAGMTGGRAFYNMNDSDEGFRRARLDSAQYYMLAYYAKDTGKYGWRKLGVRVHRDGVTIRARSGFYFNNAARDPDSTRQADEIMALSSALESTSLPIIGRWGEIDTVGDQRKVHFVLSIPPGAVLVDTEHGNHINLDFLVLAWNAKGKETAKIGQRMESRLTPADLAQMQAKGIDYANVLTLMPGEYDVHVVVRDNLKGSLGSVATRLTVQ